MAVYGVTSLPILLNTTVHKHNNQYTTTDLDYVHKTLLTFSIINFTGGEFSTDIAFELHEKLKSRFLEGHLRNWKTNNQKLREKINETESILETLLKNSEILELIWEKEKDAFIFVFEELTETASKLKPTKRNILSIYDPTGFIQPLTVTMKVLSQDICKSKINWDDELSQEIKFRWFKIIKDISHNNSFEMSHPYVNIDDGEFLKIYKLHGFSDAKKP